MKLTELPPSGFRRTPWKNGGGVNADIAADGASEGWSSFNWRFGRTAIVQPGPFSDFTGYERLQVVITGKGLVLVTPDGEIDLRVPLRPVRYDGALSIVTRLEDGPVEVINLVAAKGRQAIDLAVLQPGIALARGAGIHIAYAPVGPAKLRLNGQGVALAADHAIRIEAGGALEIIAGDGIVILGSIVATS